MLKVADAVSRVYYVPGFVDEAEEQRLLQKVYDAPRPKWVTLKNRRLQNWGGVVGNNGMVQEQMPSWLQDLFPRISQLPALEGIPMANHVLVNEYLPGQGIMYHEDGPAYHPAVATISCGSHTLLRLKARKRTNVDEKNDGDRELDAVSRDPFCLLLERRSLLVLREHAYKEFMHGIDETFKDIIIVCDNGNKAFARFPAENISDDSSVQYELIPVANWMQTEMCQNLMISAGNQPVTKDEEYCLERGTRVSLTIRSVNRVMRNPLGLLRK